MVFTDFGCIVIGVVDHQVAFQVSQMIMRFMTKRLISIQKAMKKFNDEQKTMTI
jgi:hypothetical protein